MDAIDAGNNPLCQGAITRLTGENGAGNIPRMETDLVKRIDIALKGSGLTDAGASLKAGLSKDTIRDLRRGKRRSLSADNLQRLAQALGVPFSFLGGENHAAEAQEESTATPDNRVVEPVQERQVPLMGTVAGSIVQAHVQGIEIMSRPIDWLPCPPALRLVPDIFAVYITGDSMHPMHSHGEIRFVNPHKPIQPGDSVVVETSHYADDPGQFYIKILIRRTADKLVLRQLNPEATIEIPMQFVKRVQRVLTTNELFGR